MNSDTIYALASGGSRAGVAVIRLSGPKSGDILTRLSNRSLPKPRYASRVILVDPDSGENLDDGLALWFPGPKSFTGEDVVELHCHGGRAVINGVFQVLERLDGVRMAEPGEFTRRAFENDKMDLTAAEGLGDLIHAETAAQRRQALRQMGGELGAIYERWRKVLLGTLAHFEALIDFPDEDLPVEVADGITQQVTNLCDEISAHLADGRRGERLRDGVQLAIVGAPNAGKSSLLNHLARRDVAIVSSTAGTTRDVIEIHLDLGGYPVVIADTAGLRESDCEIEAEGIRRARDHAGQADLKLAIFDGRTLTDLDHHTLDLIDEDTLVVINKSDLVALPPEVQIKDRPTFAISAKHGTGMKALLSALEHEVEQRCLPAADAGITRARHRKALEQCLEALQRFDMENLAELAGEDLRIAARALGRITGRFDVEDILDVIFGDFCIGK